MKNFTLRNSKMLAFLCVCALSSLEVAAQCSYSWFFGSLNTTIDHTLNVSDASCASVSNASITVDDAFGGNRAPLNVNQTYLWSNGATTQTADGLTSGVNYTVTITTTYTVSRIVGNPGTLTCVQVKSATPSSGSCCMTVEIATTNECGSTLGTAKVTASNGTANYSYVWSNGSSTLNVSDASNEVTGLSQGSYSVTVSDNYCSRVLNFNIGNLGSSPLVTASVVSNPACYGGSDGSAISVSAKIALSFADHTFSWTGPNGYTATNTNPSVFGISSDQIDDLYAGWYYVTVTDQQGCTASASVELTEPTQIQINPSTVSVACNGESNGSITVTPSGGTPSGSDYFYTWYDNSQSQGTSAGKSGLAAGSYAISVEDANGCVVSGNIQVNEPEILAAFGLFSVFGDYNISTPGYTNGWIKTLVTGGNGGYNYSWTGPGNPSGPNPSYLGAGVYKLNVTDSKGCEAIAGPFNLVEP